MRLLASISLILLSYSGVAQTFTVKASSSVVGVGQRVKLTYTLEGSDGSKFIQPTFPGFRLLSGPNTSSNMQWVNGNFSSSKSYSFVLLAEELGEHTIPAASIKSKGKVIQSDPIKLSVVKNKQSNRQKGKTPQNQASATDDIDLSTNVFLKLFVSKKEVFVGEQLVATYKLYTNVNIRDHNSEPPVINGFYAQDMKIDGDNNRSQETINGKQYDVYTLRKSVLTAQQSGEIEIPPFKMSFVIPVRTNQRRSIWDPWGGYKNVSYSAQSNRQTIKVKDLPKANVASQFNGAVGNFNIKVEQDRTDVNLNEAVNLRVEISGTGNLELIGEPKIEFPQDFETYEPKVRENISITSHGTRGSKTFEYVLIPRYAGEFEIKPVSLTYFDPSKGTYEQTSTSEIQVSVSRSMAGGSANEVAYVAPKKEDVQIIGKDIRYIKPLESELVEPSDQFFGSTKFYALSLAPIASAALAILLVGRIRARESDVVSLKRRKARGLAKKRLASAKKALEENSNTFYDEVFMGIHEYVRNKFNLSSSEISKERIETELRQNNIDDSIINGLISIIESCEIARFAPSQAPEKSKLLADCETVITQIENES
ncbi:MAG: BatD family protein [Salibacteraceae bacterium]